MKYVLSAVLAAFILTGCGEDEVELVKNYTLPDFKSMSIGTAIEGSKMCKNITWSREENGGLKTVKMVCDLDMEKVKTDREKQGKIIRQRKTDGALDETLKFLKFDEKTYDKEGLFKFANEHCKINDAKFQEVFKAKGRIEYIDQENIVDCDDKLKDEILKDVKSSVNKHYIMIFLKEAIYYSQLTPEQVEMDYGKTVKLPSQAAIELNFVINADKSVSLSDKFTATDNIIKKRSAFNNRKTAEDALATFYERQ